MTDLVPAPTSEAVEAAKQAMVELEMLREFFDCYEAFHKIAHNVAVPRRMKLEASQRMVDAADTLRNFRNPVQAGVTGGAPKLEVVK